MHPFSLSLGFSAWLTTRLATGLVAGALLVGSAAPAAAQATGNAQGAGSEARPVLGLGFSVVTDGGDTGTGLTVDFSRPIYSTGRVSVAPVGDFGWNAFDGFKSLTFMGGARVIGNGRRFVPFGQFLIGGFRVSTSFCDDCSETRLVLTPGGGVDIVFNRKLSFRAQIDFLIIRFPDETTGARRFTFGVSLPFGG